jgi:hypothetical protein
MSATVPRRVSPKRLFFALLLVSTLAAVFVPGASAGNFDEEKMGCAGENPATCKTGTVGQPYNLEIFLVPPDGGRGEDFSCATFHPGAGFPPGLTISDEGFITGTPTAAGNYQFYLVVKYDKNPGCFKVASDDQFIIEIKPGVPVLPKLTIGPESTSPGTVGSAYQLQMTANLPDAKQWSIASGGLPAGLTLNPSTGLISGTPMASGDFTFTVHAAINAQQTDTKTLTIAVRNPLAVNGNGTFAARTRTAQTEVGVNFSGRLAITGGQPPYQVEQSGDLPDGIEFDVSDNSFSGQSEVAGTYEFTLTVADSHGRTATYEGSIEVLPRVAITTKRLKDGRVGRVYRAKLVAKGGLQPHAWRIKRGPLPKGVRFDRATGSFVGTPAKAGIWVITVELVDGLRVKASANVTLLVRPALARRGRR